MAARNPNVQQAAALGGQALVAERGSAYMAEMGRRGGAAVSCDRAHMAAIGRRGGRAKRHGRERGAEDPAS